MVAQTILFTTVPNGVEPESAVCRVSVVVSPRLRGAAQTTLATYPDWLDWPAAVASMSFSAELPDLGLTQPATLVSTPDSSRWSALFPSDTPVHPHEYQGLDHRRIWTYPSRNLNTFLRDRWTKFGISDPEDHPSYDVLAADDAFGAIGFEQLGRNADNHPHGDGPTRKRRYLNDIEAMLDPTSDDPAQWALPFDPSGLSTPEGQAKQFLMWERYHRRGRSDRAPAPAPPDDVHGLDLHEAVALAMDHVTLPRLLGLVLDLTFPLPRTASPDTRVRIVAAWTPQLATPPNPLVGPFTRCQIGPSQFEPRAQNPGDTDYVGRWLHLGDAGRFDAFDVDLDGGAARARQFADNLTRSRRDDVKFSDLTPDTYALPHHSSGGIQVTRVDRGTETAKKVAFHVALNTQVVNGDGDPTGAEPDLFLGDLLRGIRWDVEQDGAWRSLMRQAGEYQFLTQGQGGVVAVDEEAVTGASATTAGGSDGHATDLFQAETLMRWDGWSLANHLIGASIDEDQSITDGEPADDPDGLPFRAHLQVPQGSLPRLRFGRQYRVRGRAVDIAGNSESLAETEPAGAAVDVAYHRYEPVESPSVLLRDVPTEGEANEVLVIRSEDASTADAAAGVSERHLVPPQTGQLFAEQHGVLDTGPGGALDTSAYQTIAELDGGHLGNHPDGIPDPSRAEEGDSRLYPVDHLDLNYLPDPLARQAVLRGLPPVEPPGGGLPATAAVVPFEVGEWPGYDSFRVLLEAGASSWDVDDADRRLRVVLAKAEVLDLRVSSAFDVDDLDLLGLWRWIKDSAPPNLSQLERVASTGRHWMLSPWRRVRLIHAVRTPLGPPDLPDGAFSANKSQLGQTHARLQRELAFHLNSTGRVDIRAAWSMNVDGGPGEAAPHTTDFDAMAASIAIERTPPEPRLLDELHEFGDTKHRVVTYTPVATSAFTDFFRERATVTPTGTTPVVVDSAGLETETVQVRDPLDGTEFRRARPGFPATGDYLVDETAGTIARTPGSGMADDQPVEVSYVAPEIHVVGTPRTRNVVSSARPAVPVPRWVLPTFGWAGEGTTSSPSSKTGRGLRVYLERPWWSSGAGELLGAVLWPAGPGEVPDDYVPYVSQVGFDPVHRSQTIPGNLTPLHFVNRVDTALGLELPEAGLPVDVAGHEVFFDEERDLWYADIDISLVVDQGRSYWPFVRLGLCRYQPHSLLGAHLSKTVMADFVQLSPSRQMSVAGSGATRQVTVIGRTSVGTSAATQQANRMRFRVEVHAVGATDPDLGWEPYGVRGSIQEVAPTLAGVNQATWTASLQVPPETNLPTRIVAEELETFRDGFSELQGDISVPTFGTRISHVDIVNLA